METNGTSSLIFLYKVTWGKVEDGGMGKCVTNAVSTTDWPHLVALSTYNDAMK